MLSKIYQSFIFTYNTNLRIYFNILHQLNTFSYNIFIDFTKSEKM
jgi:hypothetical protein